MKARVVKVAIISIEFCFFLLISRPIFGQATNSPTSAPAPVQANYVQDATVYGKWHSCAMGGGGFLQNVVCCPSDPKRFYAYEDVGGVYRSDDGGQNWRMMHGGLPASLASYEVRGLTVDPRSADKVIIAVGCKWDKAHAGLFASADGGVTWAKVQAGFFDGNGGTRGDGFILARDPSNPDVLVAATMGQGVFKSEDDGQTWKVIGGKPANPLDIRFDRTNSKQLWMSDAGDKTTPPAFYRSGDGGAFWVNLTAQAPAASAPAPAPPAPPAIGTKPAGPQILDPADLAGLNPSEIIQDPVDAKTIYGIFKHSLIARSQDGGATWQAFSDGLDLNFAQKAQPGISATGYSALAAGPDFIVTSTRSNSTFFKLKSGESKWEKITRDKVETGDWYGAHMGGIWFFGGNAGSVTVDVHDPAHWFMTDFFAIWQTHDSGQNWALTVNGVEGTVTHCLQQDPTNPGVVNLGQADIGPFISTDGGSHFRRARVPDIKSAPAGGKNMKCIDLCSKDPNHLYGVADRTYYDGWSIDHVFVSDDHGKTWLRTPMEGLPKEMKAKPCTSIAADLNDPNTAYLAVAGQIGTTEGSSGIYKTTDGAKTWTNISEGLPLGKYYFPYDAFFGGRQLAASMDGSLIAVSTQSLLVYRFDPAAQKWIRCNIGSSGHVWSVAADRLKSGRYFIGLRGGGVFRTDDSGVTWKCVYKGDASFVTTDAAVAGRVAAGTSHGPVLSTDGGDTWTDLDPGLPFKIDSIPCFVDERLLVGTAGSGVFWIALSPRGEKEIAAKPLASTAASTGM